MRRSGNVVPFERPAAYWAVRARRHRAPERQADKARLLRKALEKSGDPAIALELSRLYADMDCYAASERYLLRAAALGGMTGEVCFGVGCCALNRGDEALGEAALDLSLRMSPDGPSSERAQDILETYPWTYDAPLPFKARSDYWCSRARASLYSEDREEALSFARRAWKSGKTKDAAWLLGALLPPGEALPYLKAGLRLSGDMPEGRFALAHAYAKVGKKEKARETLRGAAAGCDSLRRCEGFCLSAWAAGCPEEALKLAEERLRAMPQSADYLRLMYLCLRRCGRDEEASKALDALLEIDPDDTAGLWYRRHPESLGVDAGGEAALTVLGGMVYAWPGRLKKGPLNRLLHMLTMMLAGQVEIPLIYRAAPPMWRRLTEREKWALDERRAPHLTGAFAAYLLLCAGQEEQAARMLAAAPGKKRILRLTRRLIRWREETHAVHQL